MKKIICCIIILLTIQPMFISSNPAPEPQILSHIGFGVKLLPSQNKTIYLYPFFNLSETDHYAEIHFSTKYFENKTDYQTYVIYNYYSSKFPNEYNHLFLYRNNTHYFYHFDYLQNLIFHVPLIETNLYFTILNNETYNSTYFVDCFLMGFEGYDPPFYYSWYDWHYIMFGLGTGLFLTSIYFITDTLVKFFKHYEKDITRALRKQMKIGD